MTKIRNNILLCLMIVCLMAAVAFCFVSIDIFDADVAYAGDVRYFDYRDGNGPQVATDSLNFDSPTWKDYTFVCWSRNIDDERHPVDKTKGESSSKYDIGDFVDACTYYAVWSKNGVIVTTQQLDFNVGDTVVNYLQAWHGISWSSYQLTLTNACFDVQLFSGEG
ncbi:MAG: hypothetical protein MJ193_05575, partial [Clostridia bacterium]|nr:hypothetical protein [Clostridia bacterium]